MVLADLSAGMIRCVGNRQLIVNSFYRLPLFSFQSRYQINLMEFKLSQSIASTLMTATEMFFKSRGYATTQDTFFRLFRCWSANECKLKADITAQELILLRDDLLSLVAATYLVYQANLRSVNMKGASDV